MKTNPRIQVIEHKIKNLKAQLRALGPLRPGSLSRQYHVCRKPGCRCQHPRQPQRHGSYYHLDYVHHGKKTTRFIRAEQLPGVRRQLANFKSSATGSISGSLCPWKGPKSCGGNRRSTPLKSLSALFQLGLPKKVKCTPEPFHLFGETPNRATGTVALPFSGCIATAYRWVPWRGR